jgi:ATP-dependent Clp protease adaptor protein ClpS
MESGGAKKSVKTNVPKAAKTKLEGPRFWRVVIPNDDYAPMDFVTGILMRVFNKNQAEAKALMIQARRKGKGVCGVYPKGVAESKQKEARAAANYKYPLQVEIERE